MPRTVERASWDRTLAALEDRGLIARRRGDGHVDARCPAHDDGRASMAVDYQPGDPGRVLLCCHAGCEFGAIVAALGLTERETFDGPPPEGSERILRPRRPRRAARPSPAPARPKCQHRWTQVEVYPYLHAETGALEMEAIRKECRSCGAKDFPVRCPDGRGGWVWRWPPVGHRPLFRAPEVRAAVLDGRTVFVVEGEKDVLAMERAGLVATCNPGGAGKWLPEHTAALAGAARVVVVADRDMAPPFAGYKHAAIVAGELGAADPAVSVVEVVEAAEGKDAADHLAAGRAVADLAPVDALARLAELANAAADDDQADDDQADAEPEPELPDLDRLPDPPRGAEAAAWWTAETAGGTWGSDGWATWELVQPKDAAPFWRKILDSHVRFGAERLAAPDPDFPGRAEMDDPSDATQGAADVTVRYRRGGTVVEHVVRGVAASRCRELKPLDAAGPSAWLGAAKPTPAGRAKLFEASLALSERLGRPRDVIYNVTGHRVIGAEHVLIAGTNALGRDGVRSDLIIATDDRLAPWTWPDPLPASELTAGLEAVFALLAVADPRVVVPQLAAMLRAWLGVWRDSADPAAGDEVSPTPWATGPSGHGKSGVLAACANLAAPGLRYNTLPFKAGPADTGGISGAALERLLFRARDVCLPFDDLDPSIPAAERRRWQSDLLRRAADQKSRGLAQRSGLGLRDSMPPRALVAAGGEPLEAEDSAENRALNLPFGAGVVNLDGLRAQTTPELRMIRAQAATALACELLTDWDGARAMLAAQRDARRPVFLRAGEARGPVIRGAGTAAELLAALDVFLALAVRRGADPGQCAAWRSACVDAMRDAFARHLEIIEESKRSARFLAMLGEALAAGHASLDDAEAPGCPPADPLAAGWEPIRGAATAAEGGTEPEVSSTTGALIAPRYRRRGPQAGWLGADGSAYLLPSASVAAARRLAEAAGDRWTGSAKTIGETLKADGALVIPPGQEAEARGSVKLPRALRDSGIGTRAWHVRPEAWEPPDGTPESALPDRPGDAPAWPGAAKTTGGAKNADTTGTTGTIAGQEPFSNRDHNRDRTGTNRDHNRDRPTAPPERPNGPAGPIAGQSAALDRPDRVAQERVAPDRRLSEPGSGPGFVTAADRFAAPAMVADAERGYLARPDRIEAVEIPSPMANLGHAVGWALTLKLGLAHDGAMPDDPVLVILPDLAARLGLPASPPARGSKAARQHDALVPLRSAGWQVGELGSTMRVWRQGGRTVRVWLPAWDDFGECPMWGEDVTAPTLAYRLGLFAERLGIGWRLTGGITGVDLAGTFKRRTLWVEAAEPPKPAHSGALGHAFHWSRQPMSDEAAAGWVHCYDGNGAYLAAYNTPVNVGAWRHAESPPFDKNLPGYWLIDPPEWADRLLPDLFDPTGRAAATRRTGPRWFLTPTLALAAELGYEIRPREAYLPAGQHGRFYEAWYKRVRDARAAFVGSADVDDLAVLAALKVVWHATHGQVGTKSQGARKDHDQAIIAAYAANLLRRLVKVADAGRRWPLAIGTDAVAFASADSDPVSACPAGLPLGSGLGEFKVQGSLPMADAVPLLGTGRAADIGDNKRGLFALATKYLIEHGGSDGQE